LNNEKRAVAARIFPFGLFIVRLVFYSPLSTWLQRGGTDGRFAYGILLVPVLAALVYFRRDYIELKFPTGLSASGWLRSIAVGFLVFIIWILPYPEWTNIGVGGTGFSLLNAGGNIDFSLLAMRLAGLCLAVPLMEELFWRSFLLRWIDHSKFLQIDPMRISNRAFLIVATLFALEHNLVLAGFVAGVGYNYLYQVERNLWAPLMAHTLTNTLLGIWIIYHHAWQYW
jgi:CAAX prenyl protease-like protein